MNLIRLLSLGEVVTQNQMKTLRAFSKLINPENPHESMKKIGEILQDPAIKLTLDQFKLGFKTEDEFTDEMIGKITEQTGKILTRDEFDAAWNAMNPLFSEFQSRLVEVVSQQSAEQKIIFVSYTNPKDMRHLTKELDKHGISYTRDCITGEINSVAGVSLHLSYTNKKSKAELISAVITGEMTARTPSEGYSFFGTPSTPIDIKYVLGSSSDTDPLLRALTEEAPEIGIETLLWNKTDQTFAEALHCTDGHLLSASRL
jgi:hypothetical protein